LSISFVSPAIAQWSRVRLSIEKSGVRSMAIERLGAAALRKERELQEKVSIWHDAKLQPTAVRDFCSFWETGTLFSHH